MGFSLGKWVRQKQKNIEILLLDMMMAQEDFLWYHRQLRNTKMANDSLWAKITKTDEWNEFTLKSVL
jgi:hypothetical protein